MKIVKNDLDKCGKDEGYHGIIFYRIWFDCYEELKCIIRVSVYWIVRKCIGYYINTIPKDEIKRLLNKDV